MAETLTYDNTPEAEVLTAEEQDSLKVGEEMQQAQDDLLAGKYKNAQELEKGYLELQEKLGSQESEVEELDDEEGEEGEYEDLGILDELWEYETNNEEIHEEALAELQKMDPVDIAEMHLAYRKQVEENGGTQGQDFSAEQVTQLQGVVGGKENYTRLVDWGQQAMSEQEINMFDAVMQKGDPISAFFAVKALAYAYQDAVGYEGKTIQGKAPSQSGNQFRSQAELVEAMGDPRYDKDPAYRRDVQQKLENSNINF
tara:strand:- start:415 stop:1182 length:768 start_codon:yes stop_codon:yes gene_type:complete